MDKNNNNNSNNNNNDNNVLKKLNNFISTIESLHINRWYLQ